MNKEIQRLALVTGASRGIGRAVAMDLARNGYTICINYFRNDKEASGVKEECEKFGGKAYLLKADISKADDVEKLFSEISIINGHLHTVVNNAGIRRDGPLMLMKESDWDRVLEINLKGAYLVSKKAIRPMISKRSGSIINIVSPSGLTGRQGQTNYAASKGALIAFTKSLALEVAQLGIRVNAVCPGVIETDMLHDLDNKVLDEFKAKIPSGKLGAPEDIANAVTFLTGEQSSYITGQVLIVDGGLTMGH